MRVLAYFADSGTPKTGLSPTVDIYDLLDSSLVVNDGAMTEVGDGFYKYDFSLYDTSKNYAVICDGTATLAAGERYAVGATGPGDIVVAYFASEGSPATGLTPTLNIRDCSDGSLIVTAGSMTEVGGGFYQYSFTGYTVGTDYAVLCDGGVTLSGAERYSIGANVEYLTISDRIALTVDDVDISLTVSTPAVSIEVD